MVTDQETTETETEAPKAEVPTWAAYEARWHRDRGWAQTIVNGALDSWGIHATEDTSGDDYAAIAKVEKPPPEPEPEPEPPAAEGEAEAEAAEPTEAEEPAPAEELPPPEFCTVELALIDSADFGEGEPGEKGNYMLEVLLYDGTVLGQFSPDNQTELCWAPYTDEGDWHRKRTMIEQAQDGITQIVRSFLGEGVTPKSTA